jgi:PKD repeat protein
MKKYLLFTAVFILITFSVSFGQALTCDNSTPFCTGPLITYPAATSGYAEQGAYYGCLNTQPCPAWFHLRVLDPGNISIFMIAEPVIDLDFMCWGPFTDPYTPCVGGLTEYNAVDCSYSSDHPEVCDIFEAEEGEYYILLVINYDETPGEISFSQSAGSGSLDCSIVNFMDVAFSAFPFSGPPPLSIHFTDQSSGDPVSWAWDFQNDGIYDSFLQNPNFIYNTPGSYTVKLRAQNAYETDSAIYVDYITVTIPDISIDPDSLFISQENDFSLDYYSPMLLDSFNIYNTGNYYLTINSISNDPWLNLSGYPATPFFIPIGGLMKVYVDVNWTEIDSVTTGSVKIGSNDPDEPLESVIITATPDTITGINFQLSNDPWKDIRVFPNPACDRINIRFSGCKNVPVNVRLHNATGMKMKEANYLLDATNETLGFDCKGLAPGIYLLRIISVGVQYSRKVEIF